MSTISELQHLIRAQTVAPDQRVRNLVGPVPATIQGAVLQQSSSWLRIRVPVSSMMTLDELYTLFASNAERTTSTVPADNGIAVVGVDPTIGLNLLRGTIQTAGTTSLPMQIAVAGGSGSFAVYLNGQLVKQRVGDSSFAVQVSPGRTLIEIVVLASGFAVALPPTVRVVAAGDQLAPPQWESLVAGYRDPRTGIPANILRWYTDPRVGGWILYRRVFDTVGNLVTIGEPAADGTFVVTVGATTARPTGNWTAELLPQRTTFAGYEALGTVVSVLYDSGSLTTQVTLRLTADARPSTTWVGRALLVGDLHELTRIQRSASGNTVTYTDADVVIGRVYQYGLQAYGLFDSAYLSPMSELRLLRAGDDDPPGPIVFAVDFPKVINGTMTVQFITPADDDYAGVRVTYINTLQGDTNIVGTATGSTSSTLVDSGASFTNELVGRLVWITDNTGAGQQYTVTSVPDGTTLSIAPATWYINPDTTSTYQVYTADVVITDFGVPDSTDQFSFVTVGYGTYIFSTFDHTGNIQPFSQAVLFEYDTSDDVLVGENQPPIVGIRQLLPDEQANYPVPYNEPLNYAIVELTARDPVDELLGVGIQYRRRTTTTGTSTGSSSSDTLNDTLAAWAPNQHQNYVLRLLENTGAGQERVIMSNTSNQLVLSMPWDVLPDATTTYDITWVGNLPATTVGTTLDDPRAIRSRYVAITKTDTTNWIQVRAFDKDGLYTEPVSYSPDFDSIPGVSSLDTRLDTVLDLVRVSGAVDDDTQSFEWWLEGAAADEPTVFVPNHDYADTSQQKAFPIENTGTENDIPFEFSLSDGTKKTLVIRCWSQPNFTGRSGPLITREIARSPRTVVLFENRDAQNRTSATTVRATFRCTPAIPIVSGNVDPDVGTVTTLSSVDQGTLTLTDTTQTWTVQQWEPIDAQYIGYYVRVINPDTEREQFVKIAENTATTLTLASWFDGNLGLPSSGWAYEIWAGTTFIRYSPTPGVGGFRGISAPEFIERDDTVPVYLEYYSVLSGVPAEAVHTALIDADTIASFQDLQLTEDDFDILVKPLGADDDTKRWVSYAAKGQPPAKPGVSILPAGVDVSMVTGAVYGVDVKDLNPDWERFEADWDREDDYTFDAGVGTWYVAACPINSLGQIGTCLLRSLTVTGAGGDSDPETPAGPQMTNFSVRMFDEDMGSGAGVYGEPAYNLLSWSHNAPLASPTTDYVVRIVYYRQDLGVASQAVLVDQAALRYPWMDATSGDPPVGHYATPRTSDIDETGTILGTTYDRVGSYLQEMGVRGDAAHGDPQFRWVYTAYLIQLSPLTTVATFGPITTVPTYFKDPVPAFDDMIPPTATVANPGRVSTDLDYKGNHYASPPISLRVQWTLIATSLNPSKYSFRISVAETPSPIPADYRYIADPWPVATGVTGSYVVVWNSYIADDGSGQLLDLHVQYWTFKITIIRLSDGVVIDSRTTNTLTQVIGKVPPDYAF